MGKRWTTDDMATLRTMYVAGIDYGEIGRILKRTPSACQQRTHKMGLPVIRKEQQAARQLEMDLQVASAAKTKFRESPKNQIKPSKPKPAWWSAMMWWRK